MEEENPLEEEEAGPMNDNKGGKLFCNEYK